MISNIHYTILNDDTKSEPEICWTAKFHYNDREYNIYNYNEMSSYGKCIGFLTDDNTRYDQEIFKSDTWLNLEQAIRIINLQIYK